MVRVEPSSIPQSHLLPELKDKDRWLCWYFSKDKEGHLRKKPYPYQENAVLYEPGVAQYNSPRNWLSYSQAVHVQATEGVPLGLGFVLTREDNITVLDLDNCLNPKGFKLTDPAFSLTRDMDSYTEISPSGTGLHIFLKGEIMQQGWTTQFDTFRLEIYNNYFMTVTQNHVKGTPHVVRERQSEIDELYNEYDISWPDPKFTSFWPE